MKPIKITDSNKSAIEQLLREINGKLSAHVFSDYSEISNLATDAERKLARLLGLKKYYKGAKLSATSGSPMPNAYKYSRTATKITIERRSSAWYIVAAHREVIYPNDGGSENLILTTDQDSVAIAKLRSQYGVM